MRKSLSSLAFFIVAFGTCAAVCSATSIPRQHSDDLFLKALRSAGKLEPPTLRFCADSAHRDDKHIGLKFEIRNPNNQTVKYFGYRADSFNPPLPKGTCAPCYWLNLRQGRDWDMRQSCTCATGRGILSLGPRETQSFEVSVANGGWDALIIRMQFLIPGDESDALLSSSKVITPKDIGKKELR